MTDLTHTTLERIAKARVELLLTRTFYGVLVGQVVPVVSHKVPTMATNGKQHFANPDFIAGLTQKELLGVQAHESEHDARRHHTRRGNRDPKEWNIACDYSINCDLLDEGFTLPKGALVDRKYKGMSAEDIYRAREIDRMLKQQEEDEKRKQQAQDDQNDDDSDDAQDEGDDESNDEAGDDEAGDDSDEGDDESEGDDAGDDEGEGDDAGDDAEGDTGNGEGDAEGEGDDAGTTAGTPDGTPEGEPSQEGAGEGDAGEATDTAGEAGTAPGEAASEVGEGENEPRSGGDPGGCGEVLDAAPDTADLATEDARWETVLRQAAMLAAKRGTAPGHVARELEHADHPPQDWRETLRAFFDQGAITQETWSRPNRRTIGSGLYLPGRVKDGINKVVFMIDTSGSVTYYPGALEAIQTETQAALDEGIIDSAVILYGDTRVTRVDEYRNGDEIEFDPKGGGGTVMRPLFDYVKNEVDDASMIVAFTDLEIETEDQLGGEPHCPVLWAVVGYPDRVKRYLKQTPWNAPGIEVVPSYN